MPNEDNRAGGAERRLHCGSNDGPPAPRLSVPASAAVAAGQERFFERSTPVGPVAVRWTGGCAGEISCTGSTGTSPCQKADTVPNPCGCFSPGPSWWRSIYRRRHSYTLVPGLTLNRTGNGRRAGRARRANPFANLAEGPRLVPRCRGCRPSFKNRLR